MPQPELVRKIVGVLEAAHVPYMVTGSLASSMHGEPRATHDVDLVVELRESDVDAIVAAFPAGDYYLDREQVLEAIRDRSMFNLVDTHEGDKADFWLLKDDPFDRSRFSRRQTEILLGIPVRVSAPEDTILMKLRWAALSGGSEKQFVDALRVFEVQRDNLDSGYLDGWARALGVTDLLARLRTEAEPI